METVPSTELRHDESTPRAKSLNLGIALLKSFLCLEVVSVHFWKEPCDGMLEILKSLGDFAVPTFMFVSFFLMRTKIESGSRDTAVSRLKTLLLPQLVWTVIYFCAVILFDKRSPNGTTSPFQDFFWQLFTGHSQTLNPPMWFQTDLILLSAFFFALFLRFRKRHAEIVIGLLALVSIAMQYSGINSALFRSLRFELKYPLGRIAETFPCAALGFFASKYDWLTPSKRKATACFLFAALAALCFFLDQRMTGPAGSFSYAGAWKPFFALSITAFAYNLPLRFTGKGYAIFSALTSHTLGIYCGHRLLAAALMPLVPTFNVHTGGLVFCCLVYATGLLVFSLAQRIPFTWIRKVI